MKIKWHKPVIKRGGLPKNELLSIAVGILVDHGIYKNKTSAYSCLRRYKRRQSKK